MAKDRFKRRIDYDKEFKYGVHINPVKTDRSVTHKQVELIKKMCKSEKLNQWEKLFLKSCLKQHNYSDKQKLILNNIFVKVRKV